MSRLMKEEARLYFEAAAQSAEAKEEKRFAKRIESWLERAVKTEAPAAPSAPQAA